MTSGLITPRPGAGVCPRCFNFTRSLTGLCRACELSQSHLDAIVPISYAEAGGDLHRDLADYKRTAEPAVPYLIDELAALLSSFLAGHERCVAAAAGVERFDLAVVVPSSDRRRDRHHPLRWIVGTRVPETASRYHDALVASGEVCLAHTFDRRRFTATEDLSGARVLLVDDVWTTGASAQSAAAVLRGAGAETVAAVVIGRYVNGSWGGIAERLTHLGRTDDPGACARHVHSRIGHGCLNQTGARSLGPRPMEPDLTAPSAGDGALLPEG